MFVMMLQNTLPLAIGTTEAYINKHIAAIGTRFKYVSPHPLYSGLNLKFVNALIFLLNRLLQCGLSLLQGDIFPRSLSKNILRERIYCACLDAFCCDTECPPQKAPQLGEDIAVLTKFWHTMHSDKKYLMTSSIGGG